MVEDVRNLTPFCRKLVVVPKSKLVLLPVMEKLPAKVEVAVVEVATKKFTVGEDVATKPSPEELEAKILLADKDIPRAKVPEVVIGLPLMVSPAGTDISTDVTVPDPPPAPTQVPLMAKQPAETLRP